MKSHPENGSAERREVMAFGTFDILHVGHVHYLQEAAQYGDYLTVVVSRDSVAERIAGKKTRFTQEERGRLVSALAVVDETTFGHDIQDTSGYTRIIHDRKPAVVALGHDMDVDEKALQEELKNIDVATSVVRISALHPDRYSTSGIAR